MKYLFGLLKIRPEENKKAKHLLLFYFAMGFYCTATGSITIAVFDMRFGARNLPYVFIMFPFVNLLFLFVYLKMIPVMDKRRIFGFFSLTAGILHLLGFLVISELVAFRPAYMFLLIISLLFEENFMLLAMMVLQETTDIESIKRLLPAVSGSYTAGSAAAAVIINIAAGTVNPDIMYISVLVFIPVIAFLSNKILVKFRVIRENVYAASEGGLRKALAYLRDNRFYVWLLLLTIMVGVVFNINDYLYNLSASLLLPNDAKMVGFVGMTATFRYLLTLVIEFFIFTWAVTRIGSLKSVNLVLLMAVLGITFIMAGKGHLVLILVSKVIFCVLVVQPNFSLYQIMLNPIDPGSRDSFIVAADMITGFATYFLGGLLSILHTYGLFSIINLSAFSLAVVLAAFVLWHIKQKGFIAVIEKSINHTDTAGLNRMLGSAGRARLLSYIREKLVSGNPSEKIVAIDILGSIDAENKEEILKEAFEQCGTEGKLRILDMVFEKRINACILGELTDRMEENSMQYMLVNLFLNYGSLKGTGVLEDIRRKKELISCRIHDNITHLMFERLCEENRESYGKLLEYLLEMQSDDADVTALRIMKSFAGEEDDVNRGFLQILMKSAGGRRKIIPYAVELCSIYDANGESEYLTGVFPKHCSCEVMEAVCLHYGPRTVIHRLSSRSLLIPKTFVLYAAGKLDAESAKEYHDVYTEVKGMLKSLVCEKRKIMELNRPIGRLLCDEISRLTASVFAVVLNYTFLFYGNPPLKDTERHLLSEERKHLVLEIMKNSLPANVSGELSDIIYEKYRPSEQEFNYSALDVGDRDARLMNLYKYAGGEHTDLNFCNEAESIAALKSVPMFAGLELDMLYRLLGEAVQKEFPKGRRVINKGEQGDTFYVLLKGKAGVYVNGSGQPVGTISEGEIFGEMAVIDKEERTADIVLLEDSILLEFNGDNFTDLLKRNNEIALSVIKTLSGRICGVWETVF